MRWGARGPSDPCSEVELGTLGQTGNGGPSRPSAAGPRKVLLVEDHAVTRMALCALIGAEPDLMICGEAESIAGAVDLLRNRPDIVLVDLCLGREDGFELLATLQSRFPEIPAVVVSSLDPGMYGERVHDAGALAFVPKHDVASKLVATIRQVLERGTVR